MSAADVKTAGEIVGCRNFIHVGSEDLKRPCDEHCPRPRKIFPCWLAAKTCPEPGDFGLPRSREETDVFTSRASRRTRRPAENARRLNAEIKHAIELRVSCIHCSPSPIYLFVHHVTDFRGFYKGILSEFGGAILFVSFSCDSCVSWFGSGLNPFFVALCNVVVSVRRSEPGTIPRTYQHEQSQTPKYTKHTKKTRNAFVMDRF